MTPQRLVISTILVLLVLAFFGVLGLGVLRETAGSNSYAILADGWLHGRFDVDRCADNDCALYNGKTFVIFPPVPGAIVLPFVALFGVDFHFFMPLSVLAFALSGWLWWRIARHAALGRDLAILLCLLILFATPLFFVTLRGDRVWFFAQGWGFLFATAALYCAVVSKKAVWAGLFIGMAFLSRQMTILYLPLLYVLLLDPDTPLFRIEGAAIRRALALAAFPVLAVAIYLAYNQVRFGAPLETGYSYIFPRSWETGAAAGLFSRERVRELGIFSGGYFLFNAIYMFFAGPHVEFVGRYKTELGGFDVNGASLFLVTPALLLALLAKWDRGFWFGLGIVAVILGMTLFYHSNGFSQYSAQRYALDWLPVLLLLLTRALAPAHTGLLGVLTAYSMAITLGMVVLGGLSVS